jgi:DNA-binding response OmpR family regulator
VAYGKDAELKLMTFVPDLLVTDTVSAYAEAIKLNTYSRKIGGNKILSIINQGMDHEDVQKIKDSGAEAVVTRHIEINALVEQVNALFQ